MKIRTSFVTNSSSSSFILAVKDEGFLNSGTSKLEALAKKIVFGDADVIKTKDDLDEYFLEEVVCGTQDLQEYLSHEYNSYELESYNKYLQYIQNGYLIVTRIVDYGEETMIELIRELPDGATIILIEGDC